MNERILIIAPHPDDEVLGCGGLAARYAHKGAPVYVVVVTRGIPEIFPPEDIENTRKELARAHEILGITDTYFLDFPAPCLDTIPYHKLADALRKIILEIKPTLLLIPHGGDIHADHKIVHHAAMVAARPRAPYVVSKILSYETLSETDWAVPVCSDMFIPNVFVDITDFLPLKLKAMACYESQLISGPPSRSPAVLEALARLRGSSVGVGAAEAFMLMRHVF